MLHQGSPHTPDAQGTKDLLLLAASQGMKMGCFILLTIGFFAGLPTGVLPVQHRVRLHRTLPEKACPKDNLVRSWPR